MVWSFREWAFVCLRFGKLVREVCSFPVGFCNCRICFVFELESF